MFLPSTMEASILQFASCFTQPSFQTFGVIVTGWLLAHGRRVVTRILRAGDGLEVKSFSCYHRFFSQARWSPDETCPEQRRIGLLDEFRHRQQELPFTAEEFSQRPAVLAIHNLIGHASWRLLSERNHNPTPIPVGSSRHPSFQPSTTDRTSSDPLGEGHIATWRTMLVKVACEVIQSTRRILLRRPAHRPHLSWFRRVCAGINNLAGRRSARIPQTMHPTLIFPMTLSRAIRQHARAVAKPQRVEPDWREPLWSENRRRPVES